MEENQNTDKTNTEPKKNGRPSSYTDELRVEICNRLAEGESLRRICTDAHLPDRSTVARWAYENIGQVKDGDEIIAQGFYYHYTRARDFGLDAMADEILDIADDGSNDWMDIQTERGNNKTVLDKEHVARSRLRTDSRKWYLSKLAPKRYGEASLLKHQTLDKDGEDTDPVKINVVIGEDLVKASVDAFDKALAQEAKADGDTEEST